MYRLTKQNGGLGTFFDQGSQRQKETTRHQGLVSPKARGSKKALARIKQGAKLLIYLLYIKNLNHMYLVYYNIIMKCFSMSSMKKLGLSNYFKIGLTWFRLY